MDIYIFSDESGVFDVVHNRFFVFGGLAFLSRNERELYTRKYLHAERALRQSGDYHPAAELKGCSLPNRDKAKLFRALARCLRFGVVIDQRRLLPSIFKSKKDKQRYLDYAFRRGLKHFLECLIAEGRIWTEEVRTIAVCVDEHTTATNGCYELREALEQEFKLGTFDADYKVYTPPLFPNLQRVSLQFCNSAKVPLIRGADIIANRLFFLAVNDAASLPDTGIYLLELPEI